MYLIQVKRPKPEGLQGQQSSAVFGVFIFCWSYDVDFRHMSITGASKIPTVIYYDMSGKVRAVVAEAMDEGIYETAEDENYGYSRFCVLLEASSQLHSFNYSYNDV